VSYAPSTSALIDASFTARTATVTSWSIAPSPKEFPMASPQPADSPLLPPFLEARFYLIESRLHVSINAQRSCPLASVLGCLLQAQIRGLEQLLTMTHGLSMQQAVRAMTGHTPAEPMPQQRPLDRDVVMRPTVFAFALAMERTLRKHDLVKRGQEGWRKRPIQDLLYALLTEVDELMQAFELGDDLRTGAEAVDVANFAMMLTDRVLNLATDMPILAPALSDAASTDADC
jgi:hypothetical protein